MADDNIEFIRRLYDAFSKGDVAALNEGYADDVDVHFPGRFALAGDIHGKEEVFKVLGQLAEETGGTLRIEVKDIVGRDENVVALVRFEAERNGETFAWDGAQVWRVEKEKAVEGWSLAYDQYALDEFMS